MIAVLIVAVVAFALADAAARWPNFNPDESRWLSRAHYVAALADPFGPTWGDQYMTRGQPPLGSYAMGIGLLAQGRDLRRAVEEGQRAGAAVVARLGARGDR